MKFDDHMVNRSTFYSAKYHKMEEVGMQEGIPLWVADMDLPVAPAITQALLKRASHPYFGYTYIPQEYYEAFAQWQKKRLGLDIDVNLLSPAHNVVVGLQLVLEMFRKSGDNILVQPPVYFPFYSIIEKAQCGRIDNPLIETDQGYFMDFEDMEKKIIDNKVKYFILCNPHNPIGRIWTKDELNKVADICHLHGVTVLSDEIHADLVHEGEHIPFYTVSDKAKQISMSFYSSGKTFNLPALHSAYVLFHSKVWKDQYDAISLAQNRGDANCFGIAANIAAFTESEDWYQEMMEYIQGNLDYVTNFINNEFSPKIKVRKPQATYLMWLDCRGLGLSPEALSEFFQKKAKLLLNDGELFGDEGKGFMRLNSAAPRYLLEQAMGQLKSAMDELA
ncbi:MAG: pyridoxal phosphate-dependent aminotransferase [Tissierellia bacterium]|nr:pyridoxal phosphate-dependent aminotransferase [Tissierellia bacterium]